MFKKIKNIFFLSLIVFFFGLIIFYYFSSSNIKYTNKYRVLYSNDLLTDIKNLPLLKNDTDNIIEYTNDIDVSYNQVYVSFILILCQVVTAK